MKSYHFILLCISIIFLQACSKTDLPGDNGSGDMNLENLKVGDRFLYVLLVGESHYVPDNFDFIYTGDTLELEIVDMVDDKHVIQERILPTSTVFQGGEDYVPDENDVYLNTWHIENNELHIRPHNGTELNSHLFSYQYEVNEKVLPLAPFNEDEVQLKGWRTHPSHAAASLDAFAANADVQGNEYNQLNVLIRNSPMLTDGNGRTYVYSKAHGLVRSITYHGWFQNGRSWDKI